MTAELAGGWLVVPYDGLDTELVEIGIGDEWKPAFLDYVNGVRVAKIRPPAELNPGLVISLRVSGATTPQGYLRR